jgi:uncharacterized protein YndB with AHSA1/START domain
MIEVVRERVVPAPPERVWPLVEDPDRYGAWFTFAERVEVLEGTGLGRRQRLHGRWGRKRSEIDQTVTSYEPGRRLAWRHDRERLDGKPAPRFASETEFSVELTPRDGGTLVRLRSRQVPASRPRGIAMKLFGIGQVAGNMERSLERLARAVSGSP